MSKALILSISRRPRGAGRHVIERLLDHGARVGARDRAGRTRLDLARVEGHEKVIEMLRGYGGEAKA